MVRDITNFHIQKKAIRGVYNLPYNDHTNDYFKTSNILEIKNLYKVKLCNYLFRSNASDINAIFPNFYSHIPNFMTIIHVIEIIL